MKKVKQMNNEMPIELAIENSQVELVEFINNLCNKYNLSFYLLEIIVKKIYDEISINKVKEIENIKNKYNSRIQEESKKKESKNGDKN